MPDRKTPSLNPTGPQAALEEKLRATLKDSRDPMRGPDVLQKLETVPGATEFEMRAAIWRLIDRREIELTQDRRLKFL